MLQTTWHCVVNPTRSVLTAHTMEYAIIFIESIFELMAILLVMNMYKFIYATARL